MEKQELLNYDYIVAFSGDGTPFEIINAFHQRSDLCDKAKELILV